MKMTRNTTNDGTVHHTHQVYGAGQTKMRKLITRAANEVLSIWSRPNEDEEVDKRGRQMKYLPSIWRRRRLKNGTAVEQDG